MAKEIFAPPIEAILDIDPNEEPSERRHSNTEMTKNEYKKLAGQIRNETACVLGDLHFRYEDAEALSLVMAWLAEYNPDRVFLNGDLLDFYALSHFDKSPANKDINITTEIGKLKEFLQELRENLPDADIYYIQGNHSKRLEKYLTKKAPELWEVINIPDLVGLSEYGVKWIPGKKDAFVQYGSTLIGHFDRVSKHSAYTAKLLHEQFPGYNVVQNHTHRQGLFFHTIGNKQYWAAEAGCLADLKQADYVGGTPNWQLGCMTITTDQNGEQIPELVQIINGKLYYRGDIWE